MTTGNNKKIKNRKREININDRETYHTYDQDKTNTNIVYRRRLYTKYKNGRDPIENYLSSRSKTIRDNSKNNNSEIP